MDKIIELPFSNEGFRCWTCHESLSGQARFCNHCGCIQPVRALDHFQRLGLVRSIDLDREVLERNHAALQRNFAAERFTLRSATEKNYAASHREALREAFEALRDPVRRSRYWLELHAGESLAAAPQPPQLVELRGMLDAAIEAAQLDHLACRAGQEVERGILRLLDRLRQKDWQGANEILGALDGFENLLAETRLRRAALTPLSGK